ncbi:MAG TPA: L,D-transpeptidase family protein [Hyphomicrobiales bacterium]|nr:L,D-transpeptidase family protein [Hyphomicrobiales bacterium]
MRIHSEGTAFFPWLGLGLIAGLTVGPIVFGETASARPRYRTESHSQQKAEESPPPSGPLFIVISTGKQHISVYGSNGLYARGPVSTGRPDHPTPLGIFNILGKERYHRSNIYSGAPMPFMQRVTFSGVAMHEGVLPGYPASHGCIRMPHEFARRMFSYTEGNERVIITRQDVVPANFSHPKLPVPKLMPLPVSDKIASGSTQMIRNALATAGASEKVDVAVKADTVPGASDDAERKLLNPLEFAKAMKDRAAKRAEEAAAAINPAQNAVQVKAAEAKAAAIELKKAELAFAVAKDRYEMADRQLKKVSADEAINAATSAKDAAEAKLKEAEAALEAAKRTKEQKEDEASDAVRAYKDAENFRKAAAEVVKSWNRRLAPLSVFISRKTQRLYIRQGYTRVLDVPVTIQDPEKPIGTHLYIAMQPFAQNQDGTPNLRWLVLTIPEAAKDEEWGGRRRQRGRYYQEEEAPQPAQPSATASAALDRIEMPPEVANMISEMLWAGGSMIISDSGISRETANWGTDFVILTR